MKKLVGMIALCGCVQAFLLAGSTTSLVKESGLRWSEKRDEIVLSSLKTGTIMDNFKASQMAKYDIDHPFFQPGDALVVDVEITEGSTTRIQKFAGVCIAKKGSGTTQTFTVRKMSAGIGVERTFPLYSPLVKGIAVTRRGSVRRSKLYYLRELTGKSARIKEKVRGLNLVERLESERLVNAEAKKKAQAEAAAAAAAEGEQSQEEA